MAHHHPRAAFPTTRITLIEAARGGPTPQTRDALAVLCSAYWYPIYAYVRRLGYQQEDAEDLTQGFFARVIEKQYLRGFERERGRFRSFLLGALKHFIANERDWVRAQKRGGGATPLPLEVVLRTAEDAIASNLTMTFRRKRCSNGSGRLRCLTRVQERLRAEAERDGKATHFERLKSSPTADDLGAGYRTIALDLNTTEGAIKVAVHRLRRRFRELLREEIAQTVDNPEDVGQELRDLMAAIRS